MKKRLGLLAAGGAAALVLAAVLLFSAQQQYNYVAWDVFDTVTNVTGYARSERAWNEQMEALHADLLHYHQLFDIYHEYSGMNNLCTVNKNAGVAPVEVEAPILEMLSLAQEQYAVTGGRLNVAAGSVLSLWHDYRTAGLEDPEQAALPPAEALREAALHCDWDKVQIDREAGTVYLTDADMSLDVGSVGKGYAVEQAARAAEARGLTRAFLSVGGNLRAIGTKPDGSPWIGGIESPWSEEDGGILYRVELQDASLVVSGNYQRYYTVDGVRYHHLIDLSTLQPAAYFDSVSVICADSGLADCLSTGLFCMSLQEGQALVEGLDGVEALWLLPDHSAQMSSGFSTYLRKDTAS